MQIKFKAIDPKELAKAAEINRPSIKGEMRKVYSEIHLKITEQGWAAKDVVAWFNNHGIPMTEQLFRVYLNDIDREHGFVRRPKKGSASSLMVSNQMTSLPAYTTKDDGTGNKSNNSDLQTTDYLTNKTERESKSTDTNHQMNKLLPDGSVNPEYLNAMRKESKEK